MQAEEPIVAKALAKLMQLLEQEVPKSLISFRTFQDVVWEAESQLSGPTQEGLKTRMEDAHDQTKVALQKWLQAWADYLHATPD
ncbi:MAG: hypothetical protein HY688_04265 [Chloroflexi bacterium]|nr:hypothetical protein [Chloroflexota bacterium]